MNCDQQKDKLDGSWVAGAQLFGIVQAAIEGGRKWTSRSRIFLLARRTCLAAENIRKATQGGPGGTATGSGGAGGYITYYVLEVQAHTLAISGLARVSIPN